MLVTSAGVAAALAAGELASADLLLVDARAAERFAGEVEPIDAVAGHVPGAVNHPFAPISAPHGRFLAAAAAAPAWERTLRGDARRRRLIAMCGSGVTACHNLLALESGGPSAARASTPAPGASGFAIRRAPVAPQRA